MNVKLLRKIQKHILAEPRRLKMDVFGLRVEKKQAPCGTKACIAGWACLLSGALTLGQEIGDEFDYGDAPRVAMGLLDIDGDAASRLFFVHDWPRAFGDYDSSRSAAKKSRIASARIDHFIKTKGAE